MRFSLVVLSIGIAGLLAACGETQTQRAATGAAGGAVVGGVVADAPVAGAVVGGTIGALRRP
jgi:hypothetical protein